MVETLFVVAAARADGQTDNTVAIVALIITGLVGVAGPFILSIAAARRQRGEQSAHDERQRRQLEADVQRESRESRRRVLDDGAVLLHRVNAFFLEGMKSSEQPGLVEYNRQDWDQLQEEMGVQRARLALWFDESSDVALAYRATIGAVVGAWYLRIAQSEEDDAAREAREAKLKTISAKFESSRRAYFAAAQAYVTGMAR